VYDIYVVSYVTICHYKIEIKVHCTSMSSKLSNQLLQCNRTILGAILLYIRADLTSVSMMVSNEVLSRSFRELSKALD
jgi:hypothetical protein